jgi:osmoprotectant transport system permease protein
MVTLLALILDGLLAMAVWASAPGTGRLRRWLPQPVLDDEVALVSRPPSRAPDYSSRESSLTVEGW